MTQADQSQVTAATILSPGGTVRLGDRVLRVDKLTATEEAGLYDALSDLHRRQRSPGAFFDRVRADLDFLRASGMHAEWQVLADRCAAQTMAADPGPDAVEAARKTPEGVALELFARTRKSHAEVRQDELAAVITAVNAPAVHGQIVAAVTDRGKAPTPSSSPA